MKAILSFAVLSVLMSCGPAPELKRRPESWFANKDKLSDGRIDLDKKTPAEVLQIKYNNVVNLECEFKAANPEKILDDVSPAKMSWNLVNAVEKSRIITFDVGDQHLEVEISPKMIVYGKYSTPEKNGVHYELQHTPVVELSARALDNNIQAGEINDTFFENIPAMSFVFPLEGKMPNLLSCSVKTEIAPRYEVEFQRIEKKVEPPQT